MIFSVITNEEPKNKRFDEIKITNHVQECLFYLVVDYSLLKICFQKRIEFKIINCLIFFYDFINEEILFSFLNKKNGFIKKKFDQIKITNHLKECLFYLVVDHLFLKIDFQKGFEFKIIKCLIFLCFY